MDRWRGRWSLYWFMLHVKYEYHRRHNNASVISGNIRAYIIYDFTIFHLLNYDIFLSANARVGHLSDFKSKNSCQPQRDYNIIGTCCSQILTPFTRNFFHHPTQTHPTHSHLIKKEGLPIYTSWRVSLIVKHTLTECRIYDKERGKFQISDYLVKILNPEPNNVSKLI